MRTKLGLRVAVALFLAVLMPLEVGQCAFLMPFRATAAAVAGQQHANRAHACCETSGPATTSSPATTSCCEYTPLPAATASASELLPAPLTFGHDLAVTSVSSTERIEHVTFVGFRPTARPGAPPSPATATASPRGPPHSA